jgi:leucyl aminopeptidase
MEIIATKKQIHEIASDAIVMLQFSDEKPTGELAELDKRLDGLITELIEKEEISGKFREFTLVHTDKIKSPRLLIMGLGKRKEFDVDRIRSMAGRSARILRRINALNITYSSFTDFEVDPETAGLCITEGVMLGLYHFKRHKTVQKPKKPVEKVQISARSKDEVEHITRGIKLGEILADATMLSRDLANEPANFMTPTYFADKAVELARQLNIEHYVIEEDGMKDQGMGGILAVARGSEEPAKIVVLKYLKNPGGPTLGLVGKGITFDSGGLDLKPGDSMLRMYGDCSGACSVLGAMVAIAKRQLPVNIIAVMVMCENMPSGKAFKPGDIITSMSGKTIEIISTDAEGRLILADGITLIKKAGVDMILDIATLTGGVVTALGYTASGILGNDDKLIELTKAAGVKAAENLWQLPLYEEYFSQIHSDVADMENSGGKAASTCTAAKFLQQFVDETPWVHLDIAGTAMIERERTAYLKKPYLPKEGATGVGVRTIYHLADLLSKNK